MKIKKEKDYNKASGMIGSYLEGSIFKQTFGVDAVSTMHILNQANRYGIKVYTINQDNVDSIISKLEYNSEKKKEIKNLINDGKIITIPKLNIPLYGWYGTGYIVENPDDGTAAYMISGGLAGGQVVNPDISNFQVIGGVGTVIASDLVVPDPTDLVPWKWVGYGGALIGGGIIGYFMADGSEDVEEGEEEENSKTVEDLIEDSEPGRETKGKSVQRNREGGWEQAQEDFDSLNPDNVEDRSTDEKNIKTGELDGDVKVNVRDTSSDDVPTLEVQYPNGTRIKLRYP